MVTAFALAATTLLSACGSSGRSLADPKPGVTAPPRKNSGATTSLGGGAGTGSNSGGAQINSTAFTLSTSAWATGQAIPKPYTCDGVNTSPPLSIAGVPAGTTELVLVVTDQSVANQTLWLLAGLAPTTISIPQGGVPSGAIQIVNSSGTARWSGPCPTRGTNTYEFALYALAGPSGLTTSATYAEVNAAVAKATGATVISGTYAR